MRHLDLIMTAIISRRFVSWRYICELIMSLDSVCLVFLLKSFDLLFVDVIVESTYSLIV